MVRHIGLLVSAILAAALTPGCAYNEKNISVSGIEQRIVDEIRLEQPIVTDLRENREAAERFGIPLGKIEEGFVYTNEENGKKADEIVVIKVKDKTSVSEIERALEAEITGLSVAWEGVDKSEFEKVQNHILRSKGTYVLLAICDENKKAEEIFNSMLT